MNFTSDHNFQKAFDSGNSDDAQLNDLDMKIKFDSTNFKNENNSNNNYNNEIYEISSNQKNNTIQYKII